MGKSSNISVQKALDVLVHAHYCREVCQIKDCSKMKKILSHMKDCVDKEAGLCVICRHLIALIVQHSINCCHPMCSIQFCTSIKIRIQNVRMKMIEEEESAARFMNNQIEPCTNKSLYLAPKNFKSKYAAQKIAEEDSRYLQLRTEHGAKHFFNKQFQILKRRNSVSHHFNNPISKKSFYKRALCKYTDL